MRSLLFVLLIVIAGCRRPSTQLAAMLSSPQQPDDYTTYLKAGNNVVAFGTDPAWELLISSSKNKLVFRQVKGDSVITTAPEEQTDSDGVLRYKTTSSNGNISIIFQPDSCVDKVTGQRYDYRVTVDANGKSYTGCGVSLRKLALLQDIWVLTEFDERSVAPTEPRNELPRLEISLTEGRVTGTSGCNRLSGSVRADTRQIAFGPLATTKMACLGEAGTFEQTFLNALANPLTYQIGDGKLTLLRNNKPIMRFKKVD